MVNMEIYNKCVEFKNKTGRWPRRTIKINNIRVFKKDIKEYYDEGLIDEEQYEELMEEATISNKWLNSPEHKILVMYKSVPIEDIPEEHQELVSVLRKMGLGIDGKRVDIVKLFEEFYNEHGHVPRRTTKEQADSDTSRRIERRLYQYWVTCSENKLAEEYVSVELDKIPKEHRDTISRLRAIGIGLKSKKKTNLEDYIQFVRREKREPIHYAHPTDEQMAEHDLKQKWRMCKECAIYKKYRGIMLYEIPEEDRVIVEQIRKLWSEVDGTEVAKDVIKFVKKYRREPRSVIFGTNVVNRQLTKQEQREVQLRQKWNRCFEKQVLDRFAGVPLKEIPHEYKKIVGRLRKYDLGHVETFDTRMYIKFIMDNGKRPRQAIIRNGEEVIRPNLTCDELTELRIRWRWDISEDKKIYEKHKAGTLDKETEKLYASMITDLDEADRISKLGKRKKSETTKEKVKNDKKYVEKKIKSEDVCINEIEQKIEKKQNKEIEDKINSELDKKEYSIEVAAQYIAFIKEHGRLPGKKVNLDENELSNLDIKENLLRSAWKRCKFIDIIAAYAGTPIESIPEEYRKIISDFRSEGFGLTSDEYYKFRLEKNPKEILKCVKKSRDMSEEKKQKAIELEEEVLEQLRKRSKEKSRE